MIDIGTGLRELGHDVTLLTGAGFADLARRAGLPVLALPEEEGRWNEGGRDVLR